MTFSRATHANGVIFFNKDYIVSVEYTKGSELTSLDSKLLITLTNGSSYTFRGQEAEDVLAELGVS